MSRHGARYSTVAAITLAPIVASALVAGLSWLVLARGNPNDWGALRAFFLVSATVALPTTVVVGPIVFAIMQRRRWRGWFHYVVAGAATALAASGAMIALALFGEDLSPLVVWALGIWSIPIGATTALVGWAIRRPDRDGATASAVAQG